MSVASKVADDLGLRNSWRRDDTTGVFEEVEELALQRCNISEIGSPFMGFVNVTKLDLSRNSLTSLKGLDCLCKLRWASFYLNQIADGKEVLVLSKNLEYLDTRLNPVTRAAWYRFFVIQKFDKLENLDEQKIVPYEKRRAVSVPNISPGDLYFDDDDDSESSNEKDLVSAHFGDDLVKDQNPFSNVENSILDVPLAKTMDEALLGLLQYVRTMESPKSPEDWEESMSGLNDKLISIVNFRKQEKNMEQVKEEDSTLQEKLDAALKERDSLYNSNQRLCEIIEDKKERINHLINEKDSHNSQKEVPSMLLEAHTALIDSNRVLLTELESVKDNYKNEKALWKRNFDLLREKCVL